MGAGTGDEAETQEEEEDNGQQDDIGSQVRLNCLTQENNAYTNGGTSSTDRFCIVRTISKSANEMNQSRDFLAGTNWEVQPGKNTNARPSDPPVDPEAKNEETLRQRSKAPVSTSIKLPRNERVKHNSEKPWST